MHHFTVAAHTLYEKAILIYCLSWWSNNLHESEFVQVDEDKVKVSGSRFVPTDDYFVKLEGLKSWLSHYFMCGVKDPIMISQIDTIVQSVKDRAENNLRIMELLIFPRF